MKILRTLLLLFWAASILPAQVGRLPDCFLYFNLDAAESSGSFDNRQVGCVDWSVTLTNDGFTALSVVFQEAPDSGGSPGVFATFTGTTLDGANPLTGTTADSFRGNAYRSYVRVTSTTVTGSGNIRGIIYGFRATDAAVGSGLNVVVTNTPLPVQGAETEGAAVAGDPVLVAGWDGTDAYTLKTDVNGELLTDSQNQLFDGDAGTWFNQYGCTESLPITLAAGTTEIVPLAAGEVIRVCKVVVSWDAAVDLEYVYGTGADCVTGTTVLTGTIQDLSAIADDLSGNNAALLAPASNAVCIRQTGAANGGGYVIFARY